MKTLLMGSLLIAGVVAGCGDSSTGTAANGSSDTNADSSSGSVLTAPVDYLGALGKAKQSAVKTVDLASVDQAIRMFQTEQGRLPKDLNELVQDKYLVRVPAPPYGMKLVYDAENGAVHVVKAQP